MDDHARSVRRMFTSIAPRYDLLNHLLSLNQDRRWRRVATHVALEGFDGPRVLDLCAGTGDLALELAGRSDEARVVALDFVHPMLVRAAEKIRKAGAAERIRPICGDALRLPFRDHSFDLVTMAFGLRNLSPVESALEEAARVLRPGGRIVVLEFAMPERGLWRRLYAFYFFRILPKIGKWISGTSAYSYLPASVALFHEPKRLGEALERHGFADARRLALTGGVVAVHSARRATRD